MRTSLLSRSAAAVATFALGSVALAAVPATAATPAGVTRAEVVTVNDALRSEILNGLFFFGGSGDADRYKAARTALASIVAKTCGTPTADPDDDYITAWPMLGKHADGFIVRASVLVESAEAGSTYKDCNFGVLTTDEAGATLSGEATIGFIAREVREDVRQAEPAAAPPAPLTSKLSGDVYTTPVLSYGDDDTFPYAGIRFTAAGKTTTTTDAIVTTKIWDHKSKVEKKAAKKKYVKRLKAAKKAYAKALDRAGSSAVKKAAAKKAYSALRAEAKAKYKLATWNYRYVKRAGTQTESHAFNLATNMPGGLT